MTYSILARDPKSNAIGGAAATGSLCVGGWVLRGDIRAGISASQGAAPSTLWGEDVLAAMKNGENVQDAVQSVTKGDSGRNHRQLAALDLDGVAAVFSGAENTPVVDSHIFENAVVAGNMLSNEKVLGAMATGYQSATGGFAEKLLTALRAAEEAGGDSRGLQSAALLVLSPDHAPLNLRIDYHDTPLPELEALYARATCGDYYAWSQQVPTRNAPEATLD